MVYTFNGQVLLEMESQSHQLLAGINGVVTEIIPDQGVVVETSGALIQACGETIILTRVCCW